MSFAPSEDGNAVSTSLLEALGIADKERIHSQFLAWLLSSSDIGSRHRAALSNALFGIDAGEPSWVCTEVAGIDLVAVFPNYLVLVENKLKSRQSNKQLAKYSAVAEKALAGRMPNMQAVKLLLTLTSETAHDEDWSEISYRKLLDAIDLIDWRNSNVTVYRTYLHSLVTCFEEFVQRPGKYPLIFGDRETAINRLDAALRKANPRIHEKQPDKVIQPKTNLEQFVRRNRLECIFMQGLLRRSVEGMSCVAIDESRGNALVDRWAWRIAPQDGNGQVFWAGWQFQGHSFKLTLKLQRDSKQGDSELAAQQLRAIGKPGSEWRENFKAESATGYASFSKECGLNPSTLATTEDWQKFLRDLDEHATDFWNGAKIKLRERGQVLAERDSHS